MNVAVVGGGISGLTCAWRLWKSGVHVTVFEREARPGGRMSTVDVGPFHIDIGANLLLDNYGRVRALSAELGVLPQWRTLQSGSGGILLDTGLSSFTPSNTLDVLRYGGLSVAARLRLFAYFLRAYRWQRGLDFFDLSVGDDALDSVDAYTGMCHQMGREVADNLADPFIRTFHFHGARNVSMKYFDALAALFVSRGGFVTSAFRDHMIALPRALMAALPVRLGADVTGVEASGRGVSAIINGETRQFDRVVLAMPASAAARTLRNPTRAQAALLDNALESSTLSCAFEVDADVVEDFESIWVPWQKSRIISECTNEACKGDRTATSVVLNFGLHTEAAVRLLRRSDADVARAVSDEWTRLFPQYTGTMRPLHIQRWPAAMPMYACGSISRVRRFWQSGQGDDGIYLCGDYLNHPWVEGAVRCGEKVAARILDAVDARPTPVLVEAAGQG